MYAALLVPLDRSPFAEGALPLALTLAQRAQARLELAQIHVLHGLEDPTVGRLPFDADRDAEDAERERLYLEATARWLTAVSGVPIDCGIIPGSAVLPSTVADGILQHVRQSQIDLIVIATHGRDRVRRFFLGSVADEVVRRATMPVLLVTSGEGPPTILPAPLVENVLVPLDGSALAEQILEPALELARLLEASCTLLRVVKPDSPGGRTGETVREAVAYLTGIGVRLEGHPVRVETRVTAGQHAAEAILELARAKPNSLIALATHGRGGLQRLLLGSVADEVVRSAARPVLVCRPCPDSTSESRGWGEATGLRR
jgi:nucleotide-binding universal stress UspA family protein